MGLLDSLFGFFSANVPAKRLAPFRAAGGGAYDILDRVPAPGWARLASWNAFALQTYGDNLIASGPRPGFVRPETADLAQSRLRARLGLAAEGRGGCGEP